MPVSVTRCALVPAAQRNLSLILRVLECRFVFVLQSRTTLFGTRTWDTSLHEFLCLRVRSAGDGMRYFVNIQTDGPSESFEDHLSVPLWDSQRSRLVTVQCTSSYKLPAHLQFAPTCSNTDCGCPNPLRNLTRTRGPTS